MTHWLECNKPSENYVKRPYRVPGLIPILYISSFIGIGLLVCYLHYADRTWRIACLSQTKSLTFPFLMQYDVELVQEIEKMVDHKLEEYKLNEKEVLKSITKVYSARRTAIMQASEERSRAERQGRLPTKRRRQDKTTFVEQ